MRDAIRRGVRAVRSTVRIPTVSPAMATVLVLVGLYAAMATAVVAIAIGSTAFVWSHAGPYAAATVGGVIVFAASYGGIRVVAVLRGGEYA